MANRAELLLPPKHLASCIAAGIFRDTRGVELGDRDRLNYFPATPLYAVTIVFEGQLHTASQIMTLESMQKLPPSPSVFAMSPQSTPVMSWSPGPVAALTVGFYPDAWIRLFSDQSLEQPLIPVPASLLAQLAPLQSGTLQSATQAMATDKIWNRICDALAHPWQLSRHQGGWTDWAGSDRLKDWTRHMASRMVLNGQGKSLRTIERRFRRWTGQSRQSLEFFAKIEELHRLRIEDPEAPLSHLASDARFSDQAHMGRALKRATGFSPAELNRKIADEEAFWCYRLMGERF